MSKKRFPGAARALRSLVLAAGVAGAGHSAAGTLNYIIPFPAGGESDITARIQEPVLKKISGLDVVVQYKPGAGGAAAWASVRWMGPRVIHEPGEPP